MFPPSLPPLLPPSGHQGLPYTGEEASSRHPREHASSHVVAVLGEKMRALLVPRLAWLPVATRVAARRRELPRDGIIHWLNCQAKPTQIPQNSSGSLLAKARISSSTDRKRIILLLFLCRGSSRITSATSLDATLPACHAACLCWAIPLHPLVALGVWWIRMSPRP